jgi:hypothetical protein
MGAHEPDRQRPAPPKRRFGWLSNVIPWPIDLKPILWGVDDRQTLEQIEKDVYRHRRDFRYFVLLGFVGPISISCALTALTGLIPVGRQVPSGIIFAVAFFGGHYLAVACLRRSIMADLRKTLSALGRCTCCGYDLQGIDTPQCPECGAAVETPTSDEAAP